MIYIASPYSHDDPIVVEKRYKETQEYVGQLFKENLWAFSPIVHCHALAKMYDLPTDAHYWLGYNLHMLARADALHVLQLYDWIGSVGVRNEVFFWNSLKHDALVTAIAPNSRNRRLYSAKDFLELLEGEA